MACYHISKTLIRIGYVKLVLYNEIKIDYVTKKIILHAYRFGKNIHLIFKELEPLLQRTATLI
jgi:hypothetical protein